MKLFLPLITFLALNSAFATSSQFSTQAFEADSKSAVPVVVGFHSDSCGSCKVQKPNLESLLQENSFKDIKGFMANFEGTSDFRKSLKKPVRRPSTIVIFKAGSEVARISGVTDKDELRTLLQNAISKN